MTKTKSKEMSFLGHLEELRWLLVRSTAGILIAASLAFFVSDFIFDYIIFGPKDANFITYRLFCDFSQQFSLDDSLCVKEMPFIIQNVNMGGQVSMLIWICFTAGFIISFPYILWEVWKFIKPALYDNEKKNALWFIIISSFLFFLGVLFGYFVIVPLSVFFFGTFQVSAEVINEFNLESYVGLIKTSVIACGVLFELPIVIYFLSKLGLVTPAFLRKYRKYTLIIVLILAAIITPPDIISQIIVTIPIMILYEISILISYFVQRKELKKSK
uniref:twin-arginine translocase subunit TatC n=1 Tax=Flavobacterium sp. TaxID=239 RepID=UPI004049DE9D